MSVWRSRGQKLYRAVRLVCVSFNLLRSSLRSSDARGRSIGRLWLIFSSNIFFADLCRIHRRAPSVYDCVCVRAFKNPFNLATALWWVIFARSTRCIHKPQPRPSSTLKHAGLATGVCVRVLSGGARATIIRVCVCVRVADA